MMVAPDWRPVEAVDLLRRAREAATPTADFALIASAINAALAEVETVRSLAMEDPGRDGHFQRCIERLAFAAEHMGRHAAMEGNGSAIPL